MPRTRVAVAHAVGALAVASVLIAAPPPRHASQTATAPATTRAVDGKPLDLQPVMRRIAEVVVEDRWRDQPGWRDPAIEGWLEDLLARVRAATGDSSRVFPVQFADLDPLEKGAELSGEGDLFKRSPSNPLLEPEHADWRLDIQGLRRGQVLGHKEMITSGKLVIARDVRLARVERSVILADGNARIGYAHDCIIVARGVADVTRAQGSVIVGGHLVHLLRDGLWRWPDRRQRVHDRGDPKDVAARGSVVVSGSALDVWYPTGSICVARELLNIVEAVECVFVNPPRDVSIDLQQRSRDVVAAALRVERTPHALEGDVRVDWAARHHGVVFRLGERRYVADLGQPIADEEGRPVVALAGWTVSFHYPRYIVFSDGNEDFLELVLRPDPYYASATQPSPGAGEEDASPAPDLRSTTRPSNPGNSRRGGSGRLPVFRPRWR